jgi:hypothetical protein
MTLGRALTLALVFGAILAAVRLPLGGRRR